VEPPPALRTLANTESARSVIEQAGVSGALIVQPANHKFDHSYVSAALRSHPDFYRGMLLADGSLSPLDAVASLEGLWKQGFVAARFNPSLFPAGLDGATARALYKRCGELSMPVGVMTFTGLLPHVAALRSLVAHSPTTTLIIDHMGFFRQPPTGSLDGAQPSAASDDEEAWEALLALAQLPAVHVKISALFRCSASGPPHHDLAPRVSALLTAFGPSRLLWGSDFPFAVADSDTPSDDAPRLYAKARSSLGELSVPELDVDSLAAIMSDNARRLFGFWKGR
jgi:predicted TIM-barrel fold metal-dependent hydrolase